MSLNISESQRNALDLLRVLAMLCIISCHVCQFYGSPLAFKLNIGVQLFLVISGYLYGKRTIDDWNKWFRNRFLKLYIPFVIYILVIFPLYYIFESEYLKPYSIFIYLLDLQGVLGGLRGLNHLWFMTTIAICYLVTPLLQWFCKNGRIQTPSLIVLFIIDVIYFSGWNYFVLLYAMSYGMSHINAGSKRTIVFLFISILLLIATEFGITDVISIDSLNIIWRCLIVLFILYLFIFISEFLSFHKSNIVAFISKRSYHIYIVHHLPIMLPFSILAWDANLIVRAVILFAVIAISALLLYDVSNTIVSRYYPDSSRR